jgi:hypothetical protein
MAVWERVAVVLVLVGMGKREPIGSPGLWEGMRRD